VSTEQSDVPLEIGHVLFLDIVGYSKLLITEQSELLRKLTAAVLATEQVRVANAEGKLIRVPAGDGMALVFRDNPEAPVKCAIEISKAVGQALPPAGEEQRQASALALHLRMGIHSGPVNEVVDVNGRSNVTGAGINIAQRVMDCGDAGHILLSKRVADDLEQYPQWREHLHELGPVEVKHGVKIDVVNFYNGEVGNPKLPAKLRLGARQRSRRRWMLAGAIALVVAGLGFVLLRMGGSQRGHPEGTALPVSEKSIAVLPFENLSRDPDNAFFADGVQDEILSDLAKVADLKVISRTSVTLYEAGNPRNLREIGQQLGVAHVLEGSAQRVGGKVRVNAQLVDTRTDKHLWGQSYDRDLADVFAIQSEIAQKITDQLEAKISPREKAAIEEQPTKDLAAYDLYLRAIALMDRAAYPLDEQQGPKDELEAVDLLNQAVARDATFLLAYCRLAEAHVEVYLDNVDHTPNRLAPARAAIDAAFRLKPDSGEAHLALAVYFYHGYPDYDRAHDELAIALRTLPNNARLFEWSGLIDRLQNRWHDAVRNLERAMDLDPRNVRILTGAAGTYRQVRDYERARTIADRLIALEPNNIGRRVWRAWTKIWERADLRPMQTVVEKVFEDPALLRANASDCFLVALWVRNPVGADSALAAITGNDFPPRLGPVKFTRTYAKGLIALMKGDEDGARAAFSAARTEQEKVVRAQSDDWAESAELCSLGLIDAALGRKQEALSEGRRAVELLPVTKNALDAPGILYFYAAICAQVGERDLAIEQLKTLARIAAAGATYGELRLDPFWDPLRGDPRFDAMVNDPANRLPLF
jgi:TolB-like protein/class 3 adenylate cyclase/Flp pilus assembly protein TadD